MSREGKRTAESPLSDDGYEKRQCGSAEDNSFLATDSDLTIVDPEFLSSTVLDNPAPEMASGIDIGRSIKDDLKAALCDPDVLELISKAVAAQVSSQLRKEIAGLRDKVAEKDREILFLKDQIDSLEQYSRRNCLRISPVPGSLGEHRRHCQDSRQDYWCHSPRQRHRQKPPRGKSDCRWSKQRPAYPRQVYLLQVQRGDDEGQAWSEQDRRHQDLPRLPVARPTCQVYCPRTQAVHQRGPDQDESRGGSQGQTAETRRQA